MRYSWKDERTLNQQSITFQRYMKKKKDVKKKLYLCKYMCVYFSSIVRDVAAGFSCFPSELKQMSAQTPASVSASSSSSFCCASFSSSSYDEAAEALMSGVVTVALPQKHTHSSEHPWRAFILSTVTDSSAHLYMCIHSIGCMMVWIKGPVCDIPRRWRSCEQEYQWRMVMFDSCDD